MTPLKEASKYRMLVHPLPLLKARHRARIQWMPALCALTMFSYVLYWLTQHSFAQDTHHYVTALVIASWLASLPFVFLYRSLSERRHSHGNL